MFDKPRADLKPNTYDYETHPLVSPNGFREYDARWQFGKELNLLGVQAVGFGLGTYFHEVGIEPRVVTGHDYRSYSLSIKQALTLGLMAAGEVDHPSVARGIAYLKDTQEEDGLWGQEMYTGGGFPRVFYLRYHGYPKFFPLWAVARYRNLKTGNSRAVAYGL